jgi:hypothetical protein
MDVFEGNLAEIIKKKREQVDRKLFERGEVKKNLREAEIASATSATTSPTESSISASTSATGAV